MKLRLLLTFFLLPSIGTIAQANLLPKSEIRAPLGYQKEGLDLSEDDFYRLINLIINPYRDIFRDFGMRRLLINKNWENDKINASADRVNGSFLINIYGGLARYKPLTTDGFAMVLCHEIGHLIGGAPVMTSKNKISSEGQADYFSTSKCFKTFAKNFPRNINESIVSHLAYRKCQSIYDKKIDQDICLRSSLAQESVAKTITLLDNEHNVPEITTPDTSVVESTIFDGYPSNQCRIDTLFSGSLCDVSEKIMFSFHDHNVGACTNDVANRPSCWFVQSSF